MKPRQRCAWARNPLAIAYHDKEWGVPVKDDRVLFEFLILEGAQAGLSWDTVLQKRENYRKLFAGFDPLKVSRFKKAKLDALMLEAGIIRNRAKIASTVGNAKAFLQVQMEFGSFARYAWGFVGGKPMRSRRRAMKEVPATTPESDAFSRDLKRRGFKFVGSTIIYAYMQAVGMVDDHIDRCFRRAKNRNR